MIERPPIPADEVARLVEELSHYRNIVEDQSELVSVAHTDGTLVYVNRAYARHFGKEAAELIGVSLYEYVEPRDRDAVRGRLTSLAVAGQPVTSDNRMTDADGAERWVSWTNRVQLDAQGQAMLYSVGRDVTDRKLAESALRASQSFLARSGRIAGVGGWELDLASGHITWSNETRRIHEVDDDYVPTLETAIAFYAPESRSVIEAAVQRGMESGLPWDLELSMITAKGRRIRVRAVGEVEREGGVPVRLIGAFQDVTERHRLELQIADSERFLRQLADSLPLRIAYLDDERRYRFVNQELLRHFQLPREEVIGRTRAELRLGENEVLMGQRARAALEGRAQEFEFEELVAGQLRRFENRLVPDRDESGEVRGFFVTGIDITERSAAEAALRELTAIFDNTTDFIVQTDWRGRIIYLNPSVRRALGMAADEAVTERNFSEFNTPQTTRTFEQTIIPAVKATGAWVGETTVNLAGRVEVPMSHMVLAHRDPQGRVERYSSVLRDVSAQAEARQEIARQAETLRLVAEAIPAMVAVVGVDGRYRFANSAFERWCGLPRAQIIGRTATDVLGQIEFDRRLPWVQQALRGQEVNFQLEDDRAGKKRWLEITYVPLRLGTGEADGFVTVTQDITRQRQEQLRLKGLAQRDALTGLLNRAGFQEALDGLESSAASLAVLYIDLDRFKPVNDRHGHPAGDEVLRLFAQRLSHLVRPSDWVARLGGDEFAIAVPGLPTGGMAQVLASKVLEAANAAFEIGPVHIHIGASIGVAHAAAGTVAWRELLARADEQLLRAKAAGRGRQSGDT